MKKIRSNISLPHYHWMSNIWLWLVKPCCISSLSSSVARVGGAGGARAPPHWLVKYAKSHVFCAFEADFLWKIENSPPHAKRAPPETFEVAKFWKKNRLELRRRPFFFFFFFFFFFGDHLILGEKKRLNFGFRRKNHTEFWRRPFFFFFFFFFFFLEIT